MNAPIYAWIHTRLVNSFQRFDIENKHRHHSSRIFWRCSVWNYECRISPAVTTNQIKHKVQQANVFGNKVQNVAFAQV